jgi:hypothetical protein
MLLFCRTIQDGKTRTRYEVFPKKRKQTHNDFIMMQVKKNF